nr:hypothetical protein [Tanacetum cinerariifolium]
MKASEAYKTYYAFGTGKATPKPKYVRRSTKEKTNQEPKASFSKRIKSAAKVTRSGKKRQIAEGLETLSKIALDDEDNDDKTSVSKDKDDDDQEEDDDQGNDDERTNSDNDDDDFVHPKFSTHDEEDKEEDSFDPMVQTPSHDGSMRLKIHIEECLLAIRVTYARLMRMRDFAMWDWGHRVTWGVGGSEWYCSSEERCMREGCGEMSILAGKTVRVS